MISVVLPVRDGAEQLAEALMSARHAGAEEVVVVDGGSEDGSPDIAARFGFARVLSQTGPTLADAYNEGIAAARGDLVSFIGHDDLYEPEALTQLADRIGDAGAVFGRVLFELLGDQPPPGFRRELLAGPRDALLLETLLVPRTTLEHVGPMRRVGALDIDWIARLNESSLPVLRVPELVARKRMRADSWGHRESAEDPRHLMSVLRDAVVRRQTTLSVVIPARADESYLAEALDSAWAEGAAEVVVVTPASGESAALARARDALVVDDPAANPPAQRNRGVHAASGSLVAFLDADDRFVPGRTAEMLAALGDAVTGRVRQFVSPDRVRELPGRVAVNPTPRPGAVAGALMVRREAFLTLGGFREDLKFGEVADWLARADAAGQRLAVVDAVVVERRIHGANMSLTDRAAAEVAYFRLARERIAQSRRT